MTHALPSGATKGPLRAHVRIPAKVAAFVLTTLVVLWPDPRLLIRHVRHLSDLNGLIDTEHGAIREWAGQITPDSPEEAAVIRAVERFVLEQVRYAWDWDEWGAADYVPTVTEMFDRRRPDGTLREDCDGRAVIAASLLRALGRDARIVTDLRHVWVQSDGADLMGPGRAATVVSSAAGNRVAWRSAASNALVGLSFGVAVFPWQRELIICFALVLLSIHPRMSRTALAVGAVLVIQGWLFLRTGVIVTPDHRWLDQPWPAWIGLLHVAVGWPILLVAARRARRAARPARGAA